MRMWIVWLIVGFIIVLAGVVVITLGLIKMGTDYPPESNNYEFTKYGYWGLSPDKIVEKACASDSVAEVLAGLDALRRIQAHTDYDLDEGFEGVRKIYFHFNKTSSRDNLESIQNQTPLSLSNEKSYHSFNWSPSTDSTEDYDNCRHGIDVGVFHALKSMRQSVARKAKSLAKNQERAALESVGSSAASQREKELLPKIDSFFESIKPQNDASLEKVWSRDNQLMHD